MLRHPSLSVIVTISACAGPAGHVMADDARRPNVIFIMTDNHGPWTLGCYGNEEIRTPNIDRLAEQGTLYTRCFSSNAVCSPTRATYLTGLMPSQHGVHCYLGGGHAQVGPEAYSTIEEFDTLPQILNEAGYTCGMTGKWHLGDNMNPQEGFSYWITKPHGHTTTFYDADIIENGRIRKEPKYLTEFWTDHAVRFLEQNSDRPFFLFLPYNGPYGLGGHLKNPARNRHAAYYADLDMLSFPRAEIHPWLKANREFMNNVNAMRRYAAEVSGVDDGVGRVMETLARLGLEDNTLVILAGDQGLSGGHHGLWGMGDHSRPLHAYDGTMHVPLIWREPGRIKSGQRLELMVSNYDLMPTLLSHLGLRDRMARKPESPGRDYAATLRGESIEWDDVIYYEFENTRAIRTSEWKYIHRFPDGPDELYDLKTDPGEWWNLVHDPDQTATKGELSERLSAFFSRYAEPKYDLWKGGMSKSLTVTFKDRRLPSPKAVQPVQDGS